MCGVNTYHEAGPHFGGVSAVCAARNKSLELLQLSHQTPVCKQNYMITNAINMTHLTGRVPFQFMYMYMYIHVYNTNTDIDCTPSTCTCIYLFSDSKLSTFFCRRRLSLVHSLTLNRVVQVYNIHVHVQVYNIQSCTCIYLYKRAPP